MCTELIQHINKYIQLKESDIDLISNNCTVLSLKNKDFLLKEGETCKYIYFIAKGCVRMYFYAGKGAEQITQFAIENWWITDYFSYLEQTQTEYYIQAIEKAEILAIKYSAYSELCEKIPLLERYFRIMAQRALAASQLRQRLIYDLSKEDMYLHFKNSFPDFIQRVPQYMLASFLGLTPEYLSELRKKTRLKYIS